MERPVKCIESHPRIVMFIVWTFFLLLNAFYSGALTMFFTSKPALPFTTVRQGLSDEDWKMIMVDGMQESNSMLVSSNIVFPSC